MTTPNFPMSLQRVGNRKRSSSNLKMAGRKPLRISSFARVSGVLGLLLMLSAVFTAVSYSSSLKAARRNQANGASRNAATPSARLSSGSANRRTDLIRKNSVPGGIAQSIGFPGNTLFSWLFPQAAPAETIATFAAPGCIVPKTDFNFGETVCAVVTNAPPGGGRQRLAWAHTDGFSAREVAITDETQSDSLLLTPTGEYGGETFNNAGTWRLTAIDADGAPAAVAYFTIHDPVNGASDLSVYKFPAQGQTQVNENSNVSFALSVSNRGPDAATNVVLLDVAPDATEFVSLTQDAGSLPLFSCDGSVCTIASLARGERANFTAVYHTNGVVGSTPTSYSATVSSDPPPAPGTEELHPEDNEANGEFTIVATSSTPTCTLTCPDHINAIANTTVSGQRGAYVTYDAPEPEGDCGAVTSTPASGAFFPVGTTTVTATSETNGGSCSFTVTVEEQGQDPPTISCPSNKTGTADSNCAATITVGTATATGNNVTVTATRSDGRPMYNCDVNGTNCTRRSPDEPFQSGITTITWTAYAHDIPGPYLDADHEEAHRTGSASCTQTVTVDDVTPPTISAEDQTASADASCQATVPDFTTSATVTDNCACSSSDESETCVDRERIVVTQDPAPGTVVGLGEHDIIMRANDGSSNNNGAGNTTEITVQFIVRDNTAPAIACPANITRSTDPGTCSATVDPGTATAADNCDMSPTVTGTRSDGQALNAPYPKGTTTITWTASDHANPPNTSSCQQTITVEDHEVPTITVNGANPMTVECHTSYTELGATAHDNCSADFPATASGSVNVNVVGSYTITYNATDSSGNVAVAVTRTVNVVDTTAPTITTNGQTPTMWPPNHKYKTFQVTDFVTGVSDSCDTPLGVSSVVIAQVTSDETENGNGDGNTNNDIVIAANCKSVQLRSERNGGGDGRVYTITFRVRDASGNTTTKTAKVVVPHNNGGTAVDSGPNYTVISGCP